MMDPQKILDNIDAGIRQAKANVDRTKINDGGPAFPESYVGSDMPHSGIGGGMSLRDWFAGQALKGLLSRNTWVATRGEVVTTAEFNPHEVSPTNRDRIVRTAILYADAMIAQLEESNG